jgi:hypothetical protein
MISKRIFSLSSLILFLPFISALGGEQSIVSLRDFRTIELKKTGIQISRPVTVHVKALGAGGGRQWFSKEDDLYASGWIINAKTRSLVWQMSDARTSSDGVDRICDQQISLEAGSYEIYFSAPVFSKGGWTSHFLINVDHRKKPLFKDQEDNGFFKGWWSDDLTETWEKRSKTWGIDLFVSNQDAGAVRTFTPPLEQPHIIFQTPDIGDHTIITQGITVLEPTAVTIYALGERIGDSELVDFGWLIDADSRHRVWEMTLANTRHAGGDDKNVMTTSSLTLGKGEYVLYYVTDDSHSPEDWNAFPPSDPSSWGITLFAREETERKKVKLSDYQETADAIVSLTRVGNDESRRKSFGLKEPVQFRVYAIGERSNSRRILTDYGYILDARTREKVWTMDLDHCRQAGGDSKNVLVDEVITLPKGNYTVFYKTDDSHAYNDWNADPPFDAEHYGITLWGKGKEFRRDIVMDADENVSGGIIAQIIRVGDDADVVKQFRLNRTTRIRVYAMGEGQKRSMFDYGWIENRKSGTVVWEMNYGMTFHAGGGRKNRMVNATITLEKGDYALHYVSDDSHSYNEWNDDPPEDPEFWGITLYEEEPGMKTSPIAPEPE